MSEDEKELYIAGLPCKGILERKVEEISTSGVNVYLLKKTDTSQLGFKLIFLLEMRNFSFLIPVMADKESGTFNISGICDENGIIEVIDFRKMEEYFKSDLPGDSIEIPKECYHELEEVLRLNDLLKIKEMP